MAKKKVKVAVEEVETIKPKKGKKEEKHHSGIEVPEGAGDEKNPTISLENAVNPTSPIYQA